ncbi:MAG TPA: AtpZ/AtpI family protein [Candidatus Paceibacterota bacterium]|jgi:F0F1-type ATP synthase assembly protein I|nr:AtpZ/AtpI family protein [Candidatus Paceibacterota bacterium]
MENNKKNRAWWEPALIMFAKSSIWIAVPVICALFIGKYLDKRYGTDPWMFIGMTILGFIISIVALAKISLDYIHNIEKDLPAQTEKKEKNGKSN